MTDRGNILVVDDDLESLALLAAILRAEGYEVRPANTGRLALESLAAWLPQLILLDVRMPDIGGFEVCSRLKARQKTRDIPLIFISAAHEVEECVEGLSLGAVDFICKPCRREELLARVRTHMELARLRSHLSRLVAERTAELSESEQRFRNMADTAPVMIWASGPDKLCTFFNRGWLVFRGRVMEQEVGYGWAQGVHPDDVDRFLETYTSSFDARRDFQMECRLRRADGEYRSVLNNGVPRFDSGGGFAGFIGSCVDITDLKRTQEESLAHQKLESVGLLASGIAHDFNNLLGGILASSELALAERADGTPVEEELLRIRSAALRGAEIVGQLMIYGGKGSPDFEAIDVSLLVGEMLELLKVSISKKATLKIELGENLPAVHANAPQIRQIVMNLVTNASEAIGAHGGVIRVTTSRLTGCPGMTSNPSINLGEPGYLRLEVSDTGCGMTEEVRAKIFDPFFTTKAAGHGLGLAVLRGIVRSHGGTISVASTAGSGTTVEVVLPCTDRPARLSAARTAMGEELCEACGTVLLVEDEETLRLAVSKALRKRGFPVLAAGDGRSAVNLFQDRSKDIDVVVMDLTLPGMSGPDALKEIRRIRPDVKVILTSAYDRESGATTLDGHGTAPFLRKPYRFGELVRALREVAPPSRSEAAAN
jgi:two-component system cell cycle sensor histidine kinase/response regulator CckA